MRDLRAILEQMMIASRSLMIMYRLLLLLLSTLTKSAGRLDVQMKLGTMKLIDLL